MRKIEEMRVKEREADGKKKKNRGIKVSREEENRGIERR